ncbi:MAG: DUF4147 domain-containing protein [Trueperaceae bacterium]|nr:MAG: DUF4147 domain-containing protein [Trueperaceae bacterium]
MGTHSDVLRRAFAAAVAAADPGAAVRAHLPPKPPRGRVVVVGMGKAAAPMAAAVEDHYDGLGVAVEGVVVTRYGHAAPLRRVRCLEAAHPVPDAAGEAAGRALLAAVDAAGADDLVLVLVSGGGSALACAPLPGLDLAAKQAVTDALLRSGAEIGDMNVVRKHLSSIKGGRLAARAAPARVLALVVSDVVGDDLAAVASGPTVSNGSGPADALAVLDRFGVNAPAARAALERAARERAARERAASADAGAAAGAATTQGDAEERCETRLVASNQASLEAASALLAEAGYRTLVLSNAITGEAREAGAFHAAVALQAWRHGQPAAPPVALVSGGETTVTVRGEGGRGGRNSEFALGLALALPADAPVAALAADSDGIDGYGGHAGALVTPALLRALDRVAARDALARNDSYRVFEALDHLLVTGPTRTNVNDVRVVLVGAPDQAMR